MGKKKQKKKSDINYKEMALNAITDLIVGIILLIIAKIFNL